MSSSDTAIGGYFELELANAANNSPMNKDAISLNSARNCLEYVLEVSRPSKVYIPKYTCDAVLEPFHKTGIKYEYYSINKNLEIENLPELTMNEMILYTNYFGIKDTYSNTLVEYYKSKLIIDASQAFFYQPRFTGYIFYSPRKFLGVPDGGYLMTNQPLMRDLERDSSYPRMSHLLKRLELTAEEGYQDFINNEKSIDNQPILLMSSLTRKLLSKVDYAGIRERRKANFKYIHNSLNSSNELNIEFNDTLTPMVYPYLTKNADTLRHALITQRIFVATYWPSVLNVCTEDEVESYLVSGIIPLPIDQRYDIDDMKRILEVINECNN